jgi:hypothetical protein
MTTILRPEPELSVETPDSAVQPFTLRSAPVT